MIMLKARYAGRNFAARLAFLREFFCSYHHLPDGTGAD